MTPDGLDVAAVRELAEAALRPMTCGGHKSIGSLMRCEECISRRVASEGLMRALNARAVLGLLAALAAAESARDAAEAFGQRVTMDMGEWQERAEAAEEVVREVRALADEFRGEVDWSAGRNNYGDNEAWESAARRLDELLDRIAPVIVHPTPEESR